MFSIVAHGAICSNSLPYRFLLGLIIGNKICYSADKLVLRNMGNNKIAHLHKSVTFAKLKLNLIWKLI